MSDRRQSEKTRQLVLGGALAVAVVWAVFHYFGPTATSTTTSLTGEALTYTHKDLPALLHFTPEAGETPLGGGERNPFGFGAPPTPTRNLTPLPTLPPRPTATPPPPRPTPTPGPPPPPKFDRLYIGYFGPKDRPVAVFRKGDEVEVAARGQVLDNKFIVREVGLESVDIGFVGYSEEVTSRVPMAVD